VKNPDFERALTFVLSVEGGYTNDPSDHGGATNKGITQREYTEWLGLNRLPKRSVADILNADFCEIYWCDYRLEGRCERMPWPLCLVHFDAGVNVGVGQAAKFLQRALGCKDDVAIEPVTLKSLRGALEKDSPRVAGAVFGGLAEPGGKAEDGLGSCLMRLEGMTLLAIDPGKSGGIAYVDTDGSVHALPMPETVVDLERLLRSLICVETTCFIGEIPMYRGKMNLRSTAVLFRNFGQIEGVLASLRCRVEYLKPDWWQKALRLGKSEDHEDRWKAHLKGRA